MFDRASLHTEPQTCKSKWVVKKLPGSLRVDATFSVDLVPVDPPLKGGSGVVLQSGNRHSSFNRLVMRADGFEWENVFYDTGTMFNCE